MYKFLFNVKCKYILYVKYEQPRTPVQKTNDLKDLHQTVLFVNDHYVKLAKEAAIECHAEHMLVAICFDFLLVHSEFSEKLIECLSRHLVGTECLEN